MLRDALDRLLAALPIGCAALILLALVAARNAAVDLVLGFDGLAIVDAAVAVVALGLVAWIVGRWPR